MIIWECSQCGLLRASQEPFWLPIHCLPDCGASDVDGSWCRDVQSLDELPRPVGERLRTFLSEVETWILAGSPERNDAAVDQIFATKCSLCPWFRNGTCTHNQCGCQIRSATEDKQTIIGILVSPALANKIRMETAHCPIGEW